jgi:DNA-directed RNA polymerase subunit M/transcription elongation factor TFIIS
MITIHAEQQDCPDCKARACVTVETHESSDGAHEDKKYTCSQCGKVWWIDGIDY